MDFKILYEDQDIIVVEKPVGVPSQSDRGFTVDLVSMIKNYLYEKEGKESPYVAVVHRLDRTVGGVMVYAKTKVAAAALSKQIQEGKVQKCYLTVVTKDLAAECGTEHELEDYLVRDGRSNTSEIVTKGTKDAKVSRLTYTVLNTTVVKDTLGEDQPISLLKVKLGTGRHHQIRVQMSAHLGGVWGDTKYNSAFQSRRGWSNVALFSYALSFEHPRTKKRISYHAYPVAEPFCNFNIPQLLEDK